MELHRRRFMELAGASAAIGLTAGCATGAASGRPGSEDAAALLARHAEEILAEYPESATALGLDKDGRAAIKRTLIDRSLAGDRRRAESARARLAELQRIDVASLPDSVRLDVEVARAAHELAVDGYRFPFGDVAILNSYFSYRNAPYAVAQNVGTFYEVPDILDSNHAIAGAADADAYLARLQAYATALDGETGRLAHDAGIGVVAPSFLLDKTLRQMRTARAQPLAEWGLVTSLARRTSAMPQDYAARAEAIVRNTVAPALDRQIAELDRHRLHATDDAGVWKLPEGNAYYAWALRAATTSSLTPDEVHQMGLDQLAGLHTQMDAILKAEGFTRGTVGERMTAIGHDPKYLFPNDDGGRREVIAYLDARLADVRQRLPRAFATLVPGRLAVKRVPVEIEAGAPGAYAAAGPVDGSAPGYFYINLRDVASNPKHGLATLAYHEGIPGHIWQGEYSYKLPTIRSLLQFNAYSEGWALYAEQLADELGVYEGDPVGRLGYLQSMSFRACRLVVDTGLHAKRWTREQAINWFATTNGSTVGEVASEVDRYCSWPGQACGYKIGHSEINRLRDKAKAALGDRFDYRAFNDTVVKTGGVPMTVLEQVVDRYIAA